MTNDHFDIDPRAGELVLWSTPDKRIVVAVVVSEEVGHGGGKTGWYRILADAGGGPKKYLARASHMEIITSGVNL